MSLPEEVKKYFREYYAAHKEAYSRYHKKYYAKNREIINAKNLERYYVKKTANQGQGESESQNVTG